MCAHDGLYRSLSHVQKNVLYDHNIDAPIKTLVNKISHEVRYRAFGGVGLCVEMSQGCYSRTLVLQK